MEVKLIKVLEHYHLYDGDKAIATTIVGNPMLLPNLSLKNCQEIERGYDLDELAEKACPDVISSAHSAYKAGFQKALEILGDKKFSEKDMKNAIQRARNDYNGNIIESLQQTEWDVIIKTTCDGMVTGLCMPEVCDCNIIPKLDADGCLILKRKI